MPRKQRNESRLVGKGVKPRPVHGAGHFEVVGKLELWRATSRIDSMAFNDRIERKLAMELLSRKYPGLIFSPGQHHWRIELTVL